MKKKVVLSITALLILMVFSCKKKEDKPVENSTNNNEQTNDGQVLVSAGSYVYTTSGGSGKSINSDLTVDLTHDYFIDKLEVTTKKFCEILNYGMEEGIVSVSSTSDTYKDVFYINNGLETFIYTDNISDYEIASGIIYNNNTSKFELSSTSVENLPMNQINYNSAAFYCNMLSRKNGLNELYTYETGGIYGLEYGWHCDYYGKSGYRLPTRGEWAFAFKGGGSSLNYEFSGSNTESEVGWYWEYNSEPRHAVGTKKANELGIFDMSGNIKELCCDHTSYWNEDYYVDPTGNETSGINIYDQQKPNFVFIGEGSINGGSPTSAEIETFYGDIGFRVIKYIYSNSTSNIKPTCEITKPTNTSGSFDQGDVIKVIVAATDSDGSIDNVKIYLDDVLKGTAEYSSWLSKYLYYLDTEGISSGIHILKAIATDNGGAERIAEYSAMFTSNINTSPTANFTISPSTGDLNTIFEFDASSCSDNENTTSQLSVKWDFWGEGSYGASNQANEIVTLQYPTAGTYTVIMEVTDTGGRVSTVSHTVTVTSN